MLAHHSDVFVTEHILPKVYVRLVLVFVISSRTPVWETLVYATSKIHVKVKSHSIVFLTVCG